MKICNVCKTPMIGNKCGLCGNKSFFIIEEKITKKEIIKPKIKKIKQAKTNYPIFKASITQIPEVLVCGLMYGHSGFAQATRNLAINLDKLGSNVMSVAHDIAQREDLGEGKLRDTLDRLSNNKLKGYSKFKIMMTIPMGITPTSGFYNIAYAMFESQKLPQYFVEHLKQMDELWVPSKFNYDQFRKGGYNKPLKIMPLGVDTDEFNPDKVKPLKIHNKRKFMFLSIMGFSERKGIDPLVTAFCQEFTSNEDVCLMIKAGWYDPIKSIEYISNIISNNVKKKNIPPILYNFDIMPQCDMPRLYKTADCFVLASRGEGWGLNYTEAMSMGLPTIGTKCTSQVDFMNNSNSFLVDIDGYKEEPRCTFVSPDYEGQKFANPSVKDLRKKMRFVFDNRTTAKIKGIRARKDMVDKYTWDKSVGKMKKRIEDILKGKV